MKNERLRDNDTGIIHLISHRVDGYPILACGHEPNRFSCSTGATTLAMMASDERQCSQCKLWEAEFFERRGTDKGGTK
jgi:hypothetical protein